MPTENRRRGDSIALTKSLLIAVRKRFYTGLALSVTFGGTSPKGRGLQQQQKSQRTFLVRWLFCILQLTGCR